MPQRINEPRLDELVTPKLEAALQEVSRNGRPKACRERPCAFFGDNLAQPDEETAIVFQRVELDPRLDTAWYATASASRPAKNHGGGF